MRNSPVSPEGSGAGSPATPVETTVKQVLPCNPGKDHSGADIHAAPCGGSHTRASGCAFKEAEVHGGSMSVQASDSNHSPQKEAHVGAREKCVEQGMPERSSYGLAISLNPYNTCT